MKHSTSMQHMFCCVLCHDVCLIMLVNASAGQQCRPCQHVSGWGTQVQDSCAGHASTILTGACKRRTAVQTMPAQVRLHVASFLCCGSNVPRSSLMDSMRCVGDFSCQFSQAGSVGLSAQSAQSEVSPAFTMQASTVLGSWPFVYVCDQPEVHCIASPGSYPIARVSYPSVRPWVWGHAPHVLLDLNKSTLHNTSGPLKEQGSARLMRCGTLPEWRSRRSGAALPL